MNYFLKIIRAIAAKAAGTGGIIRHLNNLERVSQDSIARLEQQVQELRGSYESLKSENKVLHSKLITDPKLPSPISIVRPLLKENQPHKDLYTFFSSVSAGVSVLELFCGNGERAVDIRKSKISKYLGLDSSEILVRYANETISDERFTFQVFDTENKSLMQEKFDVIVYCPLKTNFSILGINKTLRLGAQLLAPHGVLLFQPPYSSFLDLRAAGMDLHLLCEATNSTWRQEGSLVRIELSAKNEELRYVSNTN